MLTINLPVSFYPTNFIKWFYEKWRSIDKTHAIKSNNFDSDITRDRDYYFYESPSWSSNFQQNAKVAFILKSGHSDTFAQNLIL